jgi:hypothetical protein
MKVLVGFSHNYRDEDDRIYCLVSAKMFQVENLSELRAAFDFYCYSYAPFWGSPPTLDARMLFYVPEMQNNFTN